MKIINYKIAELVRRKNKKHKSSVLSRIVMNIKQLLARAHPGVLSALYSPAKKAKHYLSIGQSRLGQKLPISLKLEK